MCASVAPWCPAKARAIAIPVDLDSQVNTLSLKAHTNMVQRAAKDWRISARTRQRKEPLGVPDYKSIIEKLQVNTHTPVPRGYGDVLIVVCCDLPQGCVLIVVSCDLPQGVC